MLTFPRMIKAQYNIRNEQTTSYEDVVSDLICAIGDYYKSTHGPINHKSQVDMIVPKKMWDTKFYLQDEIGRTIRNYLHESHPHIRVLIDWYTKEDDSIITLVSKVPGIEAYEISY